MLMLLLSAGGDTYAVDVARVIEVVPLVEIQRLPLAPEYVAGLLNYHGVMAPVIDLGCLIREAACAPRLSTRIVLIDYPGAAAGSTHVLGLMAERVVETIDVKRERMIPTNVRVKETPYLGEMISDDRGMIPRLEVDRLLPDSLRRSLFAGHCENT